MHARGRILGLLVGAALAVTGTACSTKQADLRLVATHGSGLGPAIREHQEFSVKRGGKGRSRAVTSILFVPTPWRPSLAEAIADGVADAGGGAALAAQIETYNWWFFVSVSELRTEVVIAQIDAAGSPPTGPGEFAALSNDFVRAREGVDPIGRRVVGVEGESETRHYLWIPTSPSPPRLEDALAEAIQSGSGDLLIDADVEYTWWMIPWIYGVERWTVRGDALRSRWVETGRAESTFEPPTRP